jgi:spore germination cell wall hydrolase CwlJ-like protein
MEAEGEPWEGKLGVAYVIVNRSRIRGRSISDVVLDPYDFSAWNTDAVTRLRLDDIDLDLWDECYKAACAAIFGLVPDPTNGADHYLNEPVVLRRAGRLPSWLKHMERTTAIGQHTFYKEARG